MTAQDRSDRQAVIAREGAPLTSGEVGLGARRIDISKFGPKHPGGPAYLEAFAKRDASDAYLAFHPHARAASMQTPYAKLVAALEQDGLFKADGRQRIAFVSDLGIVAAGAALTHVHPVFAVVLALGIMRLQYTQHDIWHGQWSSDRRRSARIANAIGLLTGTTTSWWRDKDHDPHHFFCNVFPADPNNFLGIRLGAVLALPGVYLYILWCSLRDGTMWEKPVSLIHLAMLALLLSPAGWAIFLLTYCFAWVPFQLVHHPPRTIDATDWVTSQVLNTQDVVGSSVMRWLMAGHDLQMEHHLFPRMPRHRLPEAAIATAAFCEENGLRRVPIPYFKALRAFLNVWWGQHIARQPNSPDGAPSVES